MAKGAADEGDVAAAAAKAPEKEAAAELLKGPAVETVVEELPRAIVRRLVKDKLSELASSSSSRKKSSTKNSIEKEGDGEDISIQKDALLAFGESARIFIHYLSATANDVCKESKRQTINADDVLKAIEEIDFPEFLDPLRASLDEFRRKNASKRSEAKASANESAKKQKVENEEPNENGEDGEEAVEEEDKEEGEDPNENE